MSGDYASRLKEYPRKGVCGLPEKCETKRSFQRKLDKLTALVEAANRVVVLTGAGISTAAGISDFRSPTGIWTLEALSKKQAKQKHKPTPTTTTPSSPRKRRRQNSDTDDNNDDNKNGVEPLAIMQKTTTNPSSTAAAAASQNNPMPFDRARPTLTHRALYFLWKKERVQFVVTQNVDGLHRRSGLPRRGLAVLHGCVYTEKCEDCGHEFFRNAEIKGISFRRTGRHCSQCQGHLRDTLLDWEDPLPADDWVRCQQACDEADLIITLGTSLRMEPAASLVLRGRRRPPRYVIVNLQATPYDDGAALIIHAKVDEVLQALLLNMGYAADWAKEYPNPPIERDSKCIDGGNGKDWWRVLPVDDAT